ncbi:hypothetical protein XENOCAPTIV_020077 [Xenoophorus captivus]|uniref:Secreted protein n=1 Tax=Xenoophorus captivus TaxID=1517983 RepID=A0ABV0QDU7_9TELE
MQNLTHINVLSLVCVVGHNCSVVDLNEAAKSASLCWSPGVFVCRPLRLISCFVSAPIHHLRCVYVLQCVMEGDSHVLTAAICAVQVCSIIPPLTLYKRKIMR